ncbi:TolC family protein [Fibrisoma montanum]|uniref:TolC family protein n=1 Tax=Fibrisoma montanum TaxID=2305895 RepID=A0A418MI30_9BACT|nr:TolC family protein [Fibrisoma montanum]RIV27077.1 TolC family protein [Fibrisoma montanum]
MKAFYFFHLMMAWLLTPLLSRAQPVPSQPLKLSLTDAIRIGLKNSLDIQSQQLTVQIADNTIRKDRSQWLPQLDGVANVRYNTQLQSTVLPEGFFGSTTPQLVQFGTKFFNQLALDATQRIINPTLRRDIRIDQKTAESEREGLRQTEADVRLQIAEAYYAALLRKQEVALAEKSLARSRNYLDATEAKLRLGTIQEDELSRVQLDVQNADIKRRRAEKNRLLSYQKLTQVLNLSEQQPLEITDSLTTAADEATDQADFAQLVGNRPEVRSALLDTELARLRYDRAAQGQSPTLSAYANYSALYQRNDLDLFGRRSWTPFNYVGLQLNVPLFDRYATRFSKQEFALRQQVSARNLEKQKQTVYYDLQSAQTDLQNARLNLQYARENYQLANQVYQVNQAKYRLGTLLYNDLLNVEKSLEEAETNLLTSTYDLLLAKVRWQKASNQF